jgi:hypothetical protein
MSVLNRELKKEGLVNLCHERLLPDLVLIYRTLIGRTFFREKEKLRTSSMIEHLMLSETYLRGGSRISS